jgi:hypothetical protein
MDSNSLPDLRCTCIQLIFQTSEDSRERVGEIRDERDARRIRSNQPSPDADTVESPGVTISSDVIEYPDDVSSRHWLLLWTRR